MTKHELASSVWRAVKDDLIGRGLYNDGGLEMDRELVDAVMIARIENSYVAAVAAVQEENEDRLCLVDNAKLTFNKPVDGRITVDGSVFSKYDGHVVIRLDDEMVIRALNGQNYITLRQG